MLKRTQNLISRQIKKAKETAYTMATVVTLSTYSVAANATDIGAPTSGFFASFGVWMQELVDFFEGPLGLFVSIVALSIAAIIWALGQRSDEGLGRVARVVMAVLVLVNIPGLVVAIQAM
jgi:type IV secretory pathway VirB2 component (pilin)